MFQFHIGAIRSSARSIASGKLNLFQFHIGAIRRGVAFISALSDIRFNSILVQLEVTDIMAQEQNNNGFNSILVQLEAGNYSVALVELPEFQFHIGAIRRQKGLNQAN